eukprot:scaffold322195_cov33-Tisochrysis_lutea.AAC.1
MHLHRAQRSSRLRGLAVTSSPWFPGTSRTTKYLPFWESHPVTHPARPLYAGLANRPQRATRCPTSSPGSTGVPLGTGPLEHGGTAMPCATGMPILTGSGDLVPKHSVEGTCRGWSEPWAELWGGIGTCCCE